MSLTSSPLAGRFFTTRTTWAAPPPETGYALGKLQFSFTVQGKVRLLESNSDASSKQMYVAGLMLFFSTCDVSGFTVSGYNRH